MSKYNLERISEGYFGFEENVERLLEQRGELTGSWFATLQFMRLLEHTYDIELVNGKAFNKENLENTIENFNRLIVAYQACKSKILCPCRECALIDNRQRFAEENRTPLPEFAYEADFLKTLPLNWRACYDASFYREYNSTRKIYGFAALGSDDLTNSALSMDANTLSPEQLDQYLHTFLGFEREWETPEHVSASSKTNAADGGNLVLTLVVLFCLLGALFFSHYGRVGTTLL